MEEYYEVGFSHQGHVYTKVVKAENYTIACEMASRLVEYEINTIVKEISKEDYEKKKEK